MSWKTVSRFGKFQALLISVFAPFFTLREKQIVTVVRDTYLGTFRYGWAQSYLIRINRSGYYRIEAFKFDKIKTDVLDKSYRLNIM